MTKKLSYQEPWLELTSYGQDDIMTTSPQTGDDNVGGLGDWGVM